MISLATGPIDEIALVGAHCDDLAIGCGATLHALCRRQPGMTVRALVLSGGGTDRETEEREALGRLCAGATLQLRVLDLPDGQLPGHFRIAKEAIAALRDEAHAQLVLAPQRGDAHQDHRLAAEIAPTVFRDQLILGYEILKWESDLPVTTVYQPLTDAGMQHKIDVLHDCYPSQAGHDWFDEEAFRGLARVRGAQCHARHAEAFVVEKLTCELGEIR